MLYLSTISATTLELLKRIQSKDEFAKLRLVGGTALALQIGHRKSIDLDFFGIIEFEKLSINELFREFKSVEVLQKSKNINIFEINEVKVDFVNYSYPWLQKSKMTSELILAQKKDIAAMKIAAITGRGSKKDFVDLFFLLKEYSLQQILDFYIKKYFDASPYLALKSLTFFDDAEQDGDLEMIIETSWDEVKFKVKEEVKKIGI
ncbi:MAG: nucleotidyl transferase AbiEii/AbiGii toxin family protein [Bacteroidota bacterium]